MQQKASVLDRTFSNLLRGWRRISKKDYSRHLRLRANLPEADLKTLREQMQDCLESRGGEVSSRARAADLGRGYLGLNSEGRYRFLCLMVGEFGVDKAALHALVEAYLAEQSERTKTELTQDMRSLLRPPWLKLLTQFNALPSGVKFLVDMRADLLGFIKQSPELVELDKDFKRLLISWFDIGFLDLKRITWNEPASLLEKLIAYEAVHEIRSWDDLKHRLDMDRRCYAFFHPRMPEEPLIFVQVALVNGMSSNIHSLLDETVAVEDVESTDTAIFYSISNTQPGLRGISLGDFLIKRVVDDLSKQLPNLKTFATLSPIPGFRNFLTEYLQQQVHKLISEEEKQAIENLMSRDNCWYEDVNIVQTVKPALMRLCAHYLLNEKSGKLAKDRVANFHLSNGARVERINWLGDMSDHGMKQSLGLMVNYFYKLTHIERNHEAYIGQGEIPSSSTVRNTLKRTY